MKTIPVEMETVNCETGQVESRETKRFGLLPPARGTCAICAIVHEPHLPHNAQSLYYQYQFYGEHGSWPTWADAVAHCAPEMQAVWKRELKKHWSEPDNRTPIPQDHFLSN